MGPNNRPDPAPDRDVFTTDQLKTMDLAQCHFPEICNELKNLYNRICDGKDLSERGFEAMPRSIGTLPPELFEQVVQQLSLPDVGNVRLASRQLATLATQQTFKSHIVNKNVRLTKSDLQNLVEFSNPGELGCLVENLTLTSVAIDTSQLEKISKQKSRWGTDLNGPSTMSFQDESTHKCTPEEVAKVEDDMRELEDRRWEYIVLKETGVYSGLLTKAFRNLAANGKRNRLRSLTLDVVVLREDAVTEKSPEHGGGWKIIWEAASECFSIAMTSLADSKLRVDELDLFNSTYRCSLGSNSFMEIETYAKELAPSLRDMKSLSFSHVDRLLTESELRGPIDELQALTYQHANLNGLARLIGLSPGLESLQIHWYSTYACRYRDDIDVDDTQLIKTLAQTAALPCLKTLILRGVRVTEKELLALVRSAPIQKFSMENVHMEEGTFQSVFDHCTSNQAAIQKLFFDDIWERKLIIFEGEGKMKIPWGLPRRGGQTLEREGEAVKTPIRYLFFPTGRMKGSHEAYEWRDRRHREYGPPGE
ncbi:uncharacterized protein N0V89_010097 [Didymosphaeria variabile]|uniref:F-box domain-containing protein n=1 Tax=Didymosphaeria variabile TaxID=1932322 RepID=A0A9W9C8S3_9PLEO|nr:uncharacterized protein N0V89_010097 [Didymosphaeria variabile]KAJ4348719.1 hypothetical protein N0V89_010097 [Didymosphaeria variabile]